MIRSEQEYQTALRRIEEDQQFAEAQREALRQRGYSPEEVDRAMEPLLAFNAQLEDEVAWYRRVRQGDFGILHQLTSLGRLLVAIRIARGLSQRELAQRLGVAESQVSRDERNEYYGVTLKRAQSILDALGVQTETRIIANPPAEALAEIAR